MFLCGDALLEVPSDLLDSTVGLVEFPLFVAIVIVMLSYSILPFKSHLFTQLCPKPFPSWRLGG